MHNLTVFSMTKKKLILGRKSLIIFLIFCALILHKIRALTLVFCKKIFINTTYHMYNNYYYKNKINMYHNIKLLLYIYIYIINHDIL